MKQSIISKIKSAPKKPGIYIFYSQKKPLYIGKASNLRNRLKSYLKVTDLKTQSLNNEASELKYLVLRSEIEALIEESRLIKSLKPKYNIVFRDDKSYSYVYFTKENFPKIFINHEHPKKLLEPFVRIGPFTENGTLRLALKTIRRYFPYCTCLRQGYGKASLPAYSHLRDCLNAQIGRCFGYCCKKTDPSDKIAALPSVARNNKKAYAKNIRTIKTILRGQSKKLLKTLTDIKEKNALNNIFQHRPYVANNFVAGGHAVSKDAVSEKWLAAGAKVECYDISNLSGKETVGVLTALKKIAGSWLPDKNAYRKFRIRMPEQSSIRKAHTNKYFRNDPAMINQILTRRLNHPEWPYPDLIIIDGGITQFRAAKFVISSKFQVLSSKIQLISFAKPQKLVYGLKPKDEPTPISQLPKDFQELIEQAIYQTHNFAIRYHRQVRNKKFFN